MNPTPASFNKQPATRKALRSAMALGALLSLIGATQPGTASMRVEKTKVASVSATPIVGGTSYGSAVAITPDIEYSGSLTNTHKDDYFFVDVNPGAAITIEIASTTQWSANTDFYLYDQAHVSYLVYDGVPGPEQTGQLVYRGNSATPTRYYFRANMPSSLLTAVDNYTFTMRLVDQADAGQPYDAGETGVTARVITPTLNGITVYTGSMGGLDNNDYFRIAAVPGQIISASMQMLDFGPAPGTHYAYIYDAANTTTYLKYETLTAGDLAPKVLNHMSNSAGPTAYLLRMDRSTTSQSSNSRYRITIESSQQTDASTQGDAGENFDASRVITPDLSASGQLGFADDIDFFQVDLPIGTTSDARPFKFVITPVAWPAGTTGSLKIQVYNANRSVKGNALFITAPVVDPLTIDLTNCDLCYIELTDQTNRPFSYQFKLLAPKQVFLPALGKN